MNLLNATGMNMDDYYSCCGDSNSKLPAGVNCGCAFKEKDKYASLWSNPSHTYGGSMPDKQTDSGHQPGDSGAHDLAAEYADSLSQDTSQTSNRVSSVPEKQTESGNQPGESGGDAPAAEYANSSSQDTSQTSNRVSTESDIDVSVSGDIFDVRA